MAPKYAALETLPPALKNKRVWGKNIKRSLSFHKIEDYDWFNTGSVIACHGGPGAMGISGILKK